MRMVGTVAAWGEGLPGALAQPAMQPSAISNAAPLLCKKPRRFRVSAGS
jgi:hypothetical protein